ncbi:Ca2+-binding RTX toxin-like protein [Pararhizobium capsulatum DSM 1112]|uniref:Ca2+-binding RTX toxin-like protein n=1 Tax=Pararhizobium capsulatum DSM 1112 TaxID=1121113 RepID=A0ABU0BK64_9HYPH|nr:calcium-binding protein [Pararhizobium capsulatum]MDQ0318641.1 Ca2+-binding RTX toxin-like protein [Pararhizobium capsulatum DSM 1112]
MASVTYTKYAPEYFWDVFSENSAFTLAVSSDHKKVTYTFSDFETGWTKKLVLTGSAFSISGTEITGGTVTGATSYNASGQAIYTITGLSIKSYNFHHLYDFKGIALGGNDIITGTAKGDDIETGAGNDTVKAGAGDDYIKDFLGNDTYDGGSGWDVVDYSDGPRNHSWIPAKGILVNNTTVKDAYGFTDKLIGIESIRGTNFADKFIGGSSDQEFGGLAGNDVFDGGAGWDSIDYSHDAERGGRGKVTVDLSKGTAIDGFGDKDTIKNIEEVNGGKYNDTIIGDKKANYLGGREGNDVIKGGGGTDDWMEGYQGNDTLYGTKGTDDHFIFRNRDNQKLGTDHIKTFTDGEDKIHFRDFSKIDSISDLKITQSGDDTLITFSHGSIVIEDILKAKFTAADFIFDS